MEMMEGRAMGAMRHLSNLMQVDMEWASHRVDGRERVVGEGRRWDEDMFDGEFVLIDVVCYCSVEVRSAMLTSMVWEHGVRNLRRAIVAP